MYTLKKSTRLHQVVMVIKDYKLLIKSHPYATNTFKVCESEMLSKYQWLILMITQMKTKQNIIQSDCIFEFIHTEY